MKTIYKINSVIMACMAMFAVSCVDPAPVEPVFPQKQEFVKNVGETAVLSFDANLAWELSLSAPTSQFWFLEGGVKLTKWSGEAGKHDVTIHITDVSSLETDYNCEVSMTMGGQTMTVASIKVVAEKAYMKIYPALWDEQTKYWQYNDEGLVYATEAAESIDLLFDNESMNFTRPAKVESNFTWSLPVSADAAWLDAVAEQKAGVNEVVFSAVASAYPEGTASASVNVLKKGVAADAPEVTLAVNIGDYRNICIFGTDDVMVFGSEGNFTDEDVTPHRFFAAEGVEVCFATKESYGYEDNVNWLDYELALAEEQTLSGKIKEYELKILTRTNGGMQRKAQLLIKTAKAGDVFFSEDFTALAEGVYSYEIEQDGAEGVLNGPLADVSGGVESLKVMTFELLPKSANKWLYEEFGTGFVYKLNTSKATAAISFEGISADYTYEIVSVHNATAEKTVKTEWWVKPSVSGDKLTIKLDPITGNSWTDAESDKYAENQAGDSFSKTNLKYEGAYLVIKEGDNTVAVVSCSYDPRAIPVSDGVVEFVGDKPAGSYVNMVKIGDLSGELQMALSGASLYSTDMKAISEPLNLNFPVYKVRVPKATEEITLSIKNDPDGGYFIPDNVIPEWIAASTLKDGQVTFTFNDNEVHEIVYVVTEINQGPMCQSLICIVKD